MKIAILIPYYGEKWPTYFGLFLKGCERNPILDVILFTNIEVRDHSIPGNVTIIHSDLKHFNELASEKLNETIQIKEGYKLCDLRPAYGVIFEDYLANYDFWGFGDLDLVYGNVSNFIGQDMLDNHDVLSFRPWYVSGAFSLVRNDEVSNQLFKESKSWKSVFSSDTFDCFDECHHLWQELRKGQNILEIDKKQSFTYVVKKAQMEGRIKAKFLDTLKESIPSGNYLVIDNVKGVIEQPTSKGYMLYHFISEKKTHIFDFPNWNEIPDQFIINKTGFFKPGQFETPIIRMIISTNRRVVGFGRYFSYLLSRIRVKLS